jgi:hypothetical protein
MPKNPLKSQFLTPLIAMFALSLALATAGYGENIKMGGGHPLDLSSLTVVHQETFETGQSPDTVFWGVLDVGQKENDPWTGVLAKGAYALAHKGRPGAVRYYFRHHLDQPAEDPLSQYALSVDVAGKFDGKLSSAGLLYNYDPQTKSYLAFVKGDGCAYAIYRRGEQGLRRIVGGTSEAVKPGQANRLVIVPQGADINFYINNTQVATLKEEATLTGGAGLLAISPGMFAFDNFTLYRSPQPTAQLNSDPAKNAQTIPERAPITPQADEQTAAVAEARDPAVQTASGLRQERLQAYKEVLKAGMTRQRVIQLFGNPSYERSSRLFYELDGENPGSDIRTLVIQFDERGKAKRFQMLVME